jgi:uncharacterized protein (UPF0333 family)
MMKYTKSKGRFTITIALVLVLTVILTVGLLLFSACEPQKTDFEIAIDNINNQEAYIYSYKDNYASLSKVKNYKTFNNIDAVTMGTTFTVITIDCSKYSNEVTSELLSKVDEFLHSNKKVMVCFIDAPNYNFFEGTSFANEKGLYARGNEFIKAYYNFSDISGVGALDYDIGTDNETTKKELAIITLFSGEISAYAKLQ